MAMTNIQVNRTFQPNRLVSLKYWSGLHYTLNNDGSITLPQNAYIQTELVYQALDSAAYRLLTVEFTGTIPKSANISNLNTVEFDFNMTYYNDASEKCFEHFIIPFTYESATLIDAETDTYRIEKVVACTEIDSVAIAVTIKNNMTDSVTINNVSLKQSYDLQASQVANSLSYQSRVQQIVEYNNAIEVYFYGYDEPVVLTRSEDSQGNYNGVYVGENNEQFIPYDVRDINR